MPKQNVVSLFVILQEKGKTYFFESHYLKNFTKNYRNEQGREQSASAKNFN